MKDGGTGDPNRGAKDGCLVVFVVATLLFLIGFFLFAVLATSGH